MNKKTGLSLLQILALTLLAGIFCQVILWLIMWEHRSSSPAPCPSNVRSAENEDGEAKTGENTETVSLRQVTETVVLKSDHINYLTIIDEEGNEQTIETTDSHPFWVVTDEPDLERAARSVVDENGVILYHENIEPGLNGFWVEAKDLREGDVFIGANGELSTLVAKERVEFPDGIKVYNFTVDGNHNYFVVAQGEFGQTCMLVHNGICTNLGRRGGSKHIGKIEEIEKRFVEKGWEVISGGSRPEVRTYLDQTKKVYRYADLVLRKNGKTIAFQVGRATKNGAVPREIPALNELRKVFDHVFFVKYN